ncbi:MAG: Endoribonuclease [Herbaspirillum sp.]|nr:Endoribonuclease [Herbaspirillum sp.]
MVRVVESLPIGEGMALARTLTAGRWIFSQGNMATLHDGGMCAGVAADHPGRLLAEHPGKTETRWIYQNLGEQLGRVGASLADLVRIDQYFRSPAFVPPYHDVRRVVLSPLIPPSTSIVMDGLLAPSAHVCLEAIGMVGAAGMRAAATAPSDVPAPRATSGFTPVLKAGEFIFLAGQIADSANKGGLAQEATTNPQFLWDGVEIKRQATYVLKNLLKMAQAAGSDEKHVVKAQVYLRSMEDLPALREVWAEQFGSHGPALSVIPASAIALRDGMIEINLVCVECGTAIDRKSLPAGSGLASDISVVRANDLTVCSGFMASQEDQLAPSVAKAGLDKFTRSRAYEEMNFIIDRVEQELGRVGQKLSNLTRIMQFHSDLNDFRPMVRAWHDRLQTAIPVTAVQVHGALPISGASVLVDCWAVAE